MTELSPRERRFQRTQQSILDAAREIIGKQGIDALSMRTIAEKIDYSAAGLYEYYGSKEEIVQALCMQGFQRFTQALNLVDKQLPTEEYMVELGLAYIRFAMENSDFFLLMFTTAPMLFPDFSNAVAPEPEKQWREDDAFGVLVAGIQRGVDEGLFLPRRNFDVLEMARAAWALVHGIAMLQLSIMRNIPFSEEAMQVALQAQFAGMKSI